jgi:hypothetical protein
MDKTLIRYQKLVKAGDNGDNPTETEPTKNADYVPVT